MNARRLHPRPGTLRARILAELQSGRALTSMAAWRDLGVSRLAADIHALRRMGWDIEGRETLVQCRSGSPARVTAYRLAASGTGTRA